MTAAGEVEVERWLHKDRADNDARTVAAIEKRVGIVEGFWTPLSAKQALWMVTQITPQNAEEAFERVALMEPSKSSLDRLPKGLSARWEENREQHEQTLRDARCARDPEGMVTIAASIDGVLAPMEDAERTKKRAETAAAGKLTKGPAGYREVGCATLSFCDAKGDLLGAISARCCAADRALASELLADRYDAVGRLDRAAEPGRAVVAAERGISITDARAPWREAARADPSGYSVGAGGIVSTPIWASSSS
jgi:hypothetical protein